MDTRRVDITHTHAWAENSTWHIFAIHNDLIDLLSTAARIMYTTKSGKVYDITVSPSKVSDGTKWEWNDAQY